MQYLLLLLIHPKGNIPVTYLVSQSLE